MSNMSYCRFQNTFADLRECEEHFDEALDEDEAHARERILAICKRLAEYNKEDLRVSSEDEEDEEDVE